MLKKYSLTIASVIFNLSILLVLDLIMALLARFAFDEGSTLALIGSMITIIIAAHFFMKLLKNQVTAILNALWIGLGTVLVTIASYLIFDESITTQQLLAMIIVVIGVALVGYESPPKPITIKK